MKTIAPNLNGQGLKIGIVQARFTNEVGSAMVDVARKKLLELGVADDDITLINRRLDEAQGMSLGHSVHASIVK
mgnify:CR=1 FL=1